MRIGARLAAVLVIGGAMVAAAQSGGNAAERELFGDVNRARQAQGLPALKWNEALATAARKHAAMMAQHGLAQHGFSGEPALAARVTQAGGRFVWLSENVVVAGRVESVQAEFMKSPNHRANMLDADMDSIGVGVVERGGEFFAVEDFSKAK
jgi:uncharacterized protein YkwD